MRQTRISEAWHSARNTDKELEAVAVQEKHHILAGAFAVLLELEDDADDVAGCNPLENITVTGPCGLLGNYRNYRIVFRRSGNQKRIVVTRCAIGAQLTGALKVSSETAP